MNTGLLLIGGLVLTAGAVAVVSSAATKPAASGGKLGGATFNGKAYSDESITEGELADAASHGDEAARTELARRETISTYHNWCSRMGLGDSCDSYIKAGFDVTNAIAKAVGDDLASGANTPEQKARLSAAVGKIVSLGFPPTRFLSLMEFGVEDQAATIEKDIATIESGPTYDAPFLGPLDVAAMLRSAGRAATDTAGKGSLATDRLNNLFGKIANRRTVIGCMRMERPVYLIDNPVTAAKLAEISSSPASSTENVDKAHAMLAYLACAAAGSYGVSLDTAFETIALNATSFNERHGIVSRPESLETTKYYAGYPMSELGPLILAEAWYGMLTSIGKRPAPPGFMVVVKGFRPFSRSM